MDNLNDSHIREIVNLTIKNSKKTVNTMLKRSYDNK